MEQSETPVCAQCGKPLKRSQKRFCSRACSNAHRSPEIKVVWVTHFLREQSTSIWHRPGLGHKSLCGTRIIDQEEIRVEAADLPSDSECCALCQELFDQEVRRRLGRAYAILYEAAARKRRLLAEITTTEEG